MAQANILFNCFNRATIVCFAFVVQRKWKPIELNRIETNSSIFFLRLLIFLRRLQCNELRSKRKVRCCQHHDTTSFPCWNGEFRYLENPLWEATRGPRELYGRTMFSQHNHTPIQYIISWTHNGGKLGYRLLDWSYESVDNKQIRTQYIVFLFFYNLVVYLFQLLIV